RGCWCRPAPACPCGRAPARPSSRPPCPTAPIPDWPLPPRPCRWRRARRRCRRRGRPRSRSGRRAGGGRRRRILGGRLPQGDSIGIRPVLALLRYLDRLRGYVPPMAGKVTRLNRAAPRPRAVEVHGQPINFIEAGSGPVLLLIHGMAGTCANWESVIEPLAIHHTVIAPDFPGHGSSAPGGGDYSLGALASVLRDLMLTLGHERATLVGHSLGGGVAMQFTYQFPEMVERLVLVSSGGLGPDVSPILRAAALPG